MERKETPYKCHIFVCVNDRHGERKSCADGDNVEIALILKKRLKALGIQGIRVSKSLCLGVCENGPNIIIYPQGIWYSNISINDIDVIIEEIKNIVK